MARMHFSVGDVEALAFAKSDQGGPRDDLHDRAGQHGAELESLPP